MDQTAYLQSLLVKGQSQLEYQVVCTLTERVLEAAHDSQKKRNIVFQTVEWWKFTTTASAIRESRSTQPAKIVIADPTIPSGDFRYSATSFVLDPDRHWFSGGWLIGGWLLVGHG
jgi:hypothetical protein